MDCIALAHAQTVMRAWQKNPGQKNTNRVQSEGRKRVEYDDREGRIALKKPARRSKAKDSSAVLIFLPQIFLPWRSHADFITRPDPPAVAA